ncbi:MAG: hypothetical protein DLM59_18535 [Pseudonocardiales bacterium]|nr:MAG: hypothetical protein DLM59_18535 [Pseudonocardiales bacterium]
MSAKQLSAACAELGVPIERSVISNLENKRRATVSLAELIALSRVLEVPPLLLAFPVGREQETEVLPSQTVPTWSAATWFSGEAGFPHDAGGPSEPMHGARWENADPNFEQGSVPLQLFRDHTLQLEQRSLNRMAAQSLSIAAETAATDAERAAHVQTADSYEGRVRHFEDAIRRTRSEMRKAGLVPPPLPPALGHLDGQATS